MVKGLLIYVLNTLDQRERLKSHFVTLDYLDKSLWKLMHKLKELPPRLVHPNKHDMFSFCIITKLFRECQIFKNFFILARISRRQNPFARTKHANEEVTWSALPTREQEWGKLLPIVWVITQIDEACALQRGFMWHHNEWHGTSRYCT